MCFFPRSALKLIYYSFTFFFGSGSFFSPSAHAAQLSIKKKKRATLSKDINRDPSFILVLLREMESNRGKGALVSHSRALLSFRAFEISSSRKFSLHSFRPIIIVITEKTKHEIITYRLRMALDCVARLRTEREKRKNLSEFLAITISFLNESN